MKIASDQASTVATTSPQGVRRATTRCEDDAAFSAITTPACMIKTLIQSVLPRKEPRYAPQVLKEMLHENARARVIESRDDLGFPRYSVLLEQHIVADRSNRTVGILHINPQLLQQLEVMREAAEWCSKRLALR